MEGSGPIELPNEPVSIGILVVTAFEPLTMDGILAALANVGAPSWLPVDEVVAGAVDRLLARSLLERIAADRQPGRFAPTDAAWASLPTLLDRLPLSATAPDIGYKLRVMSLDLLEPPARAAQLQALVAHWRGVMSLWQTAEDRCPCRQPSVRHWMKHNLALARLEVDWLSTIAAASSAEHRPRH